MISQVPQLLFFLEALMFATVIFMHLSKKSSTVVSLYVVQSLIVASMLFSSFFEKPTFMLLFAALAMFAVKVLVAPYFFKKLVQENHLRFSASAYVSGPMTLAIIAGLTGLIYSQMFTPLAILSPENTTAMLLSLAMLLISVFLIINRKGALSQMVGVLSLENAIVSFAFLSGLEQSPMLQLGILFDILAWIMIATVFASMVYKQFGSLDVTVMTNLKEE